MNLIPCPNCGENISNTCTVCPHCGHVAADKNKAIVSQEMYVEMPKIYFQCEGDTTFDFGPIELNRELANYLAYWHVIRDLFGDLKDLILENYDENAFLTKTHLVEYLFDEKLLFIKIYDDNEFNIVLLDSNRKLLKEELLNIYDEDFPYSVCKAFNMIVEFIRLGSLTHKIYSMVLSLQTEFDCHNDKEVNISNKFIRIDKSLLIKNTWVRQQNISRVLNECESIKDSLSLNIYDRPIEYAYYGGKLLDTMFYGYEKIEELEYCKYLIYDFVSDLYVFNCLQEIKFKDDKIKAHVLSEFDSIMKLCKDIY